MKLTDQQKRWILMGLEQEAVKEDLDIEELSEEEIIYKPSGEKCPHLKFKGEEASCCIHHYRWYQETPCYSHSQLEAGNQPCRLGDHFQMKGISFNGTDNGTGSIKNSIKRD